MEVQDCKEEDTLVAVQLVLVVVVVVVVVVVEAGKAGEWWPWPSSSLRPPVLTGGGAR